MPRAPSSPPSGVPDGTETIVRGPSERRPLGAVITVVGARASPSRYVLRAGKCVIGAAAPCDIVIDEPTVSRTHAELALVPEGIAVCDLKSRNGTFYLGQRVERMILALGGRIKVGAAEVAIDADAESLGSDHVYAGDSFRGMVAVSTSMRRLFATILRLDGSLATVLVTGESGVGKELIARAIHEGSSVSEGPLTVVNCGAIPKDLAASELFGHRRGAFTGAVETHRGAFERADGGTLFLDEIGELPLDVQPLLLRALETGEVRPVGGEQSRHVRTRLISATHRDLQEEVRAGRFREDLFYRVAVVKLSVPPLRERPEDIEPLAQQFAGAIGLPNLPAALLERLKAQPWRGNVRELRNVVQAYGAIGAMPDAPESSLGLLRVALQQFIDVERPYADLKDDLVDLFTRLYLEQLLAHSGDNQTLAARIAGIDRSYLGRLLNKHGMSKG